MGARVTGIDLSSASVELARSHASLDPLVAKNVTYQAISTEQLVEQGEPLLNSTTPASSAQISSSHLRMCTQVAYCCASDSLRHLPCKMLDDERRTLRA